MSRHYHDSDCTPAALETIADRLDDLAEQLERLIAIVEMTKLTDQQREQLRLEREAER